MAKLHYVLPITACACIFLNACTAQRVELGSPEYNALLSADKRSAADTEAPATMTLTLEQALERAVSRNFDARVAALEALSKEDDLDLTRLQAMPQFNLSRTQYGRSNEGASSSRSIITGSQSLEPSFSTERYHNTRELALNWSTIDVLLAIAQSKSAGDEAQIAHLRHEKVLQNIERDVASAYWRAYAAQETHEENKRLLARADNYLGNLGSADKQKLLSATKTAQFQDSIYKEKQDLAKLARELPYAEIELKSLLSIPQGTQLLLTSKPKDYKAPSKKVLAESTIKLEEEALYNRPEIQETILQKNIDAQNTRNEILRTLPGADLFFSLNKDSNAFLYESEWASFSGTIAQSLTSLFTAPVRYRAAKNIEELGEARRVSLIAAVMTQVHLSRHRLNMAMQDYESQQLIYKTSLEQARATKAQRDNGLLAGQTDIAAQLQAQTAKLRSLQSQADMQDAYAELRNTLGRSTRNDQRNGRAG